MAHLHDSNHAEYMVIKKCQPEELEGATLYTTLEPCTSHSRDPHTRSCTGKIIDARIREVVWVIDDTNPYVFGREMLTERNISWRKIENEAIKERAQVQLRDLRSKLWSKFIYLSNHVCTIDVNFVGYNDIRAELSRWLSRQGRNGGKPVLELTAFGGFGKSSIAWFWLHKDILRKEVPGSFLYYSKKDRRKDPLSDQEPHVVIWWSFYGSGLAGDFKSFLVYLQVILSYLKNILSCETVTTTKNTLWRHDDLNKEIEAAWRQAAQTQHTLWSHDVLNFPADKRFLIVWDGAERLLQEYSSDKQLYMRERPEADIGKGERTLVDKKAAGDFLSLVLNSPHCKLLILSRLPLADLEDKAAGQLPLCGLSRDNAKQYLEAKINRTIPDTELDILFRRLGYDPARPSKTGIHPLSLKLPMLV